ncbi:MAG TPA: hypothetical protein VK702_04445 [Candidatus Acidoferrum sp.]|jgi:uncharacterized FlaG/YvyC family protein|nr:hypothetical protein [Candidatus Acidoferrum sp.]
MDVPAVAPASTGQSEGVAPTQTVAAAPQAPAPSLASSSSAAPKPVPNSTIAEAVAKIYNVSSGSSGQPQLAISYKYVSELQLVVTVFTNPQTGEEVAQFPPQELIGLAEFFDQIDGVTLDRKV